MTRDRKVEDKGSQGGSWTCTWPLALTNELPSSPHLPHFELTSDIVSSYQHGTVQQDINKQNNNKKGFKRYLKNLWGGHKWFVQFFFFFLTVYAHIVSWEKFNCSGVTVSICQSNCSYTARASQWNHMWGQDCVKASSFLVHRYGRNSIFFLFSIVMMKTCQKYPPTSDAATLLCSCMVTVCNYFSTDVNVLQ